jgi:hypothetical protein
MEVIKIIMTELWKGLGILNNEHRETMKKYFIICCILLSPWMIMEAQSWRPNVGAKAGVNISNVWDAEGQNFQADSKAGFVAGVFAGIPIGSFLGFQPELLVSQKGFQGSGTLFGETYRVRRTTSYFDIPLQLQLRPAPILTVLVGPQYSYLFKEKNEYTWGPNATVQQAEFSTANLRRNILGLVGGVDVDVAFLLLSARLGMDMIRNNGDGTSDVPRYKNRWIQLTAGFKI